MKHKHIDNDVLAGQAVYSKKVLSIYDLLVIKFSNRFVWKCPSSNILKMYNRHITSNHLEVAAGTGYFPDNCRFPSPSPRLCLLDLNPNSLEEASGRLIRYAPKLHRYNILEPIPIELPPFDSIAVNYLFHCLPGTMETKGVVLQNLERLLKPGGILFGSTLLKEAPGYNGRAKWLMRFYNRKRIFTNHSDSAEALKNILKQNFDESSVKIIGCAALFEGKKAG
ncbi:MAG: class I SAM-dependent methyltransferase, partial [bacterium]|nr:class I SAM-dependent methyltransferase [bacterium]